jgi:hypothetical protein
LEPENIFLCVQYRDDFLFNFPKSLMVKNYTKI